MDLTHAYRFIGFINLFLLVVANLIMKPRRVFATLKMI
jgi:hypothetical protein